MLAPSCDGDQAAIGRFVPLVYSGLHVVLPGHGPDEHLEPTLPIIDLSSEAELHLAHVHIDRRGTAEPAGNHT